MLLRDWHTMSGGPVSFTQGCTSASRHETGPTRGPVVIRNSDGSGQGRSVECRTANGGRSSEILVVDGYFTSGIAAHGGGQLVGQLQRGWTPDILGKVMGST